MVDRPNVRDREEDILVLAARPQLTAAQQTAIRAHTATPFDWSRLLALAEAHGLWPLVFAHLTAAGAPVPADIARDLARRAVELTALNLSLAAQLASIVDCLRENGVPAVALKGPLLAQAYGHVGLRPFGDLDVLVARRDGPRARDVLRAQGYRDADQYSVLDGVHPAAGREYVLVPPGAGVAVELLVDVSDWTLPVALPADSLIARGVPRAIAGLRIPALSAEDDLLALVLHGVRHAWTSVRYISDLHVVATRPLAWTAIMARAEAARMTRMLRIGVLLAHRVMHTPLPPDLLAECEGDRVAGRLAAEIDARLFVSHSPRSLRRWRTVATLRSRERAADKCRFAVRTVAFEQVVRPLDEWRSVRGGAAWRTAKLARRLALPLVVMAIIAASRSGWPLLVGGVLLGLLTAIYLVIHVWAARREPVRAWTDRHA